MKKTTILLLIVLGIANLFAQSEKLQAMEQELVFFHNTAKQLWLYQYKNYGYEESFLHYQKMQELAYEQFDGMLNMMLVEDRDMTYPFTELKNSGIHGVDIIWSSDSLLRVFSWMLPGGTQHIYGNAIQYKNTKSIACSFPFDIDYESFDNINGGYQYYTVYTLEDHNKTIYILFGRTNFSTRIVGYQLLAFSIQDELVAENIFEDENGNLTNEISISYEIGCNDINGEAFLRLTIDENKKILNLLGTKDVNIQFFINILSK